MKGKELVDFITKNNLEDFDFTFSFTDRYNTFPNVRTFKITGVADIGYSDKVIDLEGEED